MLKVAITGNIASGKTLVLDYFKTNGFKTLCLDEVTHEIYLNSKTFQAFLFKEFNTTKRYEIAKFVFENKNKLKLLEENIYPEILNYMDIFFDKNKDETITFVGAPMLFESNFDKFFDKIILVVSNNSTRLNRLIKRNNFSKEEALKRIQAQAIQEEKIEKSNFIISNDDTIENLYKNCDKVIKEIKLLL